MEVRRHPATKESAEAFQYPALAHPEVAEEARRHPSTGVSLQPSPARSVHQTATHQDHRLAHPSNQEAEARPEVTKARRPAFRHPEMATEMAPAHHQAFLLDAGACKLIQGHFRDDLHHHPEASAHRQRILERPEEVEARPEVTKAHPDSEDLEVVVVAYREFRGVAHRPTAEV